MPLIEAIILEQKPHGWKLTCYGVWNKPEKAKAWRAKLPKTEAVEE